MMKNFTIVFSGFLFSIGLFVSGMTNPHKVISFLNVTGAWDPSLLFVMVGAIVPTFLFYRFVSGHKEPLFETKFDFPTKISLDRSLVVGSILFGIGWGISGVCPGPGVANIFAGHFDFLFFVISMLVGLVIGGKIKI